ncbi:hypothetical protein Hanom_Chr09g00808581 [Helianthus anomalus]
MLLSHILVRVFLVFEMNTMKIVVPLSKSASLSCSSSNLLLSHVHLQICFCTCFLFFSIFR